MNNELYRNSIQKGLEWIEKNMLTIYDGYNGMYERIRIDKKIRTNWVRPDGNTELAKLLTFAEYFGKLPKDMRPPCAGCRELRTIT